MSLNNQIFSLRQAIIKAKRKAKQQQRSSQDEQSIQNLEEPIHLKLKAKHVPINANHKKNSQKIQHKPTQNDDLILIAQDIYSQKKQKLSYSRRQDLERSDHSSNQKRIKSIQNIKNRSQKVLKSNSNSNSNIKNSNSHEKKKNRDQNIKNSGDRSPLTYSKSIQKRNGQDSRVSTFSINSKLSKKSNIEEKLAQFRKLVSNSQKNLSQRIKKSQNGLNNCDSKVNDAKYSQLSMQQNQQITCYVVDPQKIGISSLFSKYYANSYFDKKKLSNKNGSFYSNKKENFHNLINEWKQVKHQLNSICD